MNPSNKSLQDEKIQELERRCRIAEETYLRLMRSNNDLRNEIQAALEVLESQDRLLRDHEDTLAEQSNRLQNNIDRIKRCLDGTA